MAIGKITGSVVADNTLTESNLAFGVSGQSSATSWTTDSLSIGTAYTFPTTDGSNTQVLATDGAGNISFVDAGGTLTVADDASSTITIITTTDTLKISGGDSLTSSVSGDTVTIDLDENITVNTISSTDSTAIQLDDSVNISGTLSVNTIDVNTLTSSDSSGININNTKLYVNGGSVITTTSTDQPAITTNAGDIDQVLINDGGIAKRIALGNINVSSFNNDANYASSASTGFVNSTVTTIPISEDSTATDYGVGEPVGVGTATDTTDPFGVPLGTTFDCMEPRGTTQSSDFGTEEAHVGA